MTNLTHFQEREATKNFLCENWRRRDVSLHAILNRVRQRKSPQGREEGMRRVPIDPLEISHFLPYSQLFCSIFAEVPVIAEISLVPSKNPKRFSAFP